MDTRRVLSIVALVLLAGFTRWLVLREDDAGGADTLPLARSDYTLEQFDLLVMNQQGDPSFRVESPYLEKNPDDGSLDLQRPVVFLFDQTQEDWRIDADDGWIRGDGEEMELRGKVRLARGEAPKRLTIRTQNLRIFPNDDRAHSAEPVHIERPGATLQGVGLRAQLDTERIEILSEVKGHYEPPQ